MRLRSIPLIVALLVFAAGACTAAPNSGGQTATNAPATRTTARASIAMKGQARYAPPGLLPVAQRKPAPALQVTTLTGARSPWLGWVGGRWW